MNNCNHEIFFSGAMGGENPYSWHRSLLAGAVLLVPYSSSVFLALRLRRIWILDFLHWSSPNTRKHSLNVVIHSLRHAVFFPVGARRFLSLEDTRSRPPTSTPWIFQRSCNRRITICDCNWRPHAMKWLRNLATPSLLPSILGLFSSPLSRTWWMCFWIHSNKIAATGFA